MCSNTQRARRSRNFRRIDYLIFTAILSVGPVLADEPIRVKAVSIDEIAFFPQHAAPATAVSLNSTTISSEVDGRILSIIVRVGDRVATGTQLGSLDCKDHRLLAERVGSELKVNEDRIGLAERRLTRTRGLALTLSVSEEVLDERESELSILRSERLELVSKLRRTNVDIERCSPTSPYDAVVTERVASVGDYIKVGDPIVKIVDTANIEVSAKVSIADVPRLRVASLLSFHHQGAEYPLRLRATMPVIRTATRDTDVRLDFLSAVPSHGAAGQLIWRDSRPHIPGDVLVRRDGSYGIFTVSNNNAVFHKLPTAQAGRAIAVDLADSVLVVTDGQFALRDGDPVEIMR